MFSLSFAARKTESINSVDIALRSVKPVLFSHETVTKSSSAGVTRTVLQGLAVYLTPNFEGLTLKRFLQILLDAMSQIFFSLSVSMGIMITYGSYIKKDDRMFCFRA